MSSIVVDCSVTMAWGLRDEATDFTDSVLRTVQENGAEAPLLWFLEVTNVLLMAQKRKRISRQEAREFMAMLGALPIEVDVLEPPDVFTTVIDLAEKHGLTTYDAAYLELAMKMELPLASRDHELNFAARKEGVETLG